MFILKGWVKHTKDIIKPLEIFLLSILFIVIIIFIKFKPVYTVTLSGQTLGYVTEKSELENKINQYINTREGTIALIDIAVMPEYNFELVLKDEITSEDEILERVKETAVITHKFYAVTVNGDAITEVNTALEAESIIATLQSDLKEGVNFELAVAEVYKTEQTSVSQDTALSKLNEIKVAKTQEYEAEQARLEQERLAKEKAAREEAARRAALIAAQQQASRAASYTGAYGNVNGISVGNPLRSSVLITSRFGESSSRRYSTHTGLDLATSLGTPMYPIAAGTVTFSGWQGSYGNMVIIDHGNGVQSWYAHCNSLNVGVGNQVGADTNIATVGSTGNSTGPHLHLEIRVNGSPVNPQNFIY